MASVSASHLIIFIASLIVAAAVAGTITNTVGGLSEAIDNVGITLSEDVRTDVEIISDSGATVYNTSGGENVTLYVKNVGSERLSTDPSTVSVMLDGSYQSEVNLTVVDGTAWQPGDVVRLDVHAPDLSAGDHRVQVTVNGDEEVFQFRT